MTRQRAIEILHGYSEFTKYMIEAGYELDELTVTILGTTAEMFFRINGEKELDNLINFIKAESRDGAPKLGVKFR